jgi:hypothetical protein
MKPAFNRDGQFGTDILHDNQAAELGCVISRDATGTDVLLDISIQFNRLPSRQLAGRTHSCKRQSASPLNP